MDGVVRRGPVLAPRVVTPKQITPAVAAMPAASVRYVTGIDGIRRRAPQTAARVILASMQAPLAVEAPPAVISEVMADSVVYPGRSWGRQIGFGLVASALIAGGAYSWQVARASSQAQATSRAASALHATSVQPSPNAIAAAAALAVAQQETGLQKLLTEFAAGHENQLGIVVKDLKSGATAQIGGDTSMTSASLYKLFVAQQIYGQIDNGQLTYGSNAGSGSGRNIDGCLTVMINISDNTCGRALGSVLGWDDQDAALKADGYTGTSLQTPQQTSAHDVAFLLERLYRGTLNSPNANDRFMALLKDQRVNNRLPQGLPAGTVIAHKTGDLDGYTHDAGIVFGTKTDYLVVMMGKPGTTAGQFADLSSRLWTFFQQ